MMNKTLTIINWPVPKDQQTDIQREATKLFSRNILTKKKQNKNRKRLKIEFWEGEFWCPLVICSWTWLYSFWMFLVLLVLLAKNMAKSCRLTRTQFSHQHFWDPLLSAVCFGSNHHFGEHMPLKQKYFLNFSFFCFINNNRKNNYTNNNKNKKKNKNNWKYNNNWSQKYVIIFISIIKNNKSFMLLIIKFKER